MIILIVDAEVVFASLIKRGFTLNLIRLLSKKGYKLVTPEYIFEEVRRKEEKLLKYSKLELARLWFVFFLALKKISPIPEEKYSRFLEEAKKISPIEDFPYVALAFMYKSQGKEVKIWSNDPELKSSLGDKIQVVSTEEIKF